MLPFYPESYFKWKKRKTNTQILPKSDKVACNSCGYSFKGFYCPSCGFDQGIVKESLQGS